MVLQAGLAPTAGFAHHGHGHGHGLGHSHGHGHGQGQGYLHKEEHYKENYYKDGFSHKEDYYKNDYYSNNSSSHTRPTSGIHSSYGHNSHIGGHGGYPQHNYGHGGYPQHGYGAPHGTHVPVGPTRYEEKHEYHHQGHNSSRPYYEQKENHSWVSKDLDD